MGSREQILTAIRDAGVAPSPYPELLAAKQGADNWERFSGVIESVGGKAISVRSAEEIAPTLAALPISAEARRTASCVSGVELGNVRLDSVSDVRELETLDIAIVPGELAVAENGAVWVNPAALRHRAVLFLATHLILVVPRSGLVTTMGEAYERLDFRSHGTAYFISGPSKTADIEQNLVIGAQGPKSLTVVLLG